MISFLFWINAASQMFSAIEGNDIEAIRDAIKSDPTVINVCDGKGVTVLHKAAEVGNLDIFKILAEAGADKNAYCEKKYVSWIAAAFGHLPILKYLDEQGVLLNYENELGNNIFNAFSISLFVGEGISLDVLNFLLEKKDIRVNPCRSLDLGYLAEFGSSYLDDYLFKWIGKPESFSLVVFDRLLQAGMFCDKRELVRKLFFKIRSIEKNYHTGFCASRYLTCLMNRDPDAYYIDSWDSFVPFSVSATPEATVSFANLVSKLTYNSKAHYSMLRIGLFLRYSCMREINNKVNILIKEFLLPAEDMYGNNFEAHDIMRLVIEWPGLTSEKKKAEKERFFGSIATLQLFSYLECAEKRSLNRLERCLPDKVKEPSEFRYRENKRMEDRKEIGEIRRRVELGIMSKSRLELATFLEGKEGS